LFLIPYLGRLDGCHGEASHAGGMVMVVVAQQVRRR
jgi:hypothetical protein